MEDVDDAKRRAQERANQIQVFVQKMNGGTLALNMRANDTIATLKKKISDELKIAPSQQSLTFGGKPLSDGARTLESYGIGNHSTINMSGRLRGGRRN